MAESTREKLEKQRAQIEARLKALDAKDKTEQRKRDARRKIIVGGAVLAHAAQHPAFADVLRGVLNAAVTREIDRKVITDLLGGSVPPDSSIQGDGQKEKEKGV